MKLDNHFDAIKQMESQLTSNINTRYPDTTTGTGGVGGSGGPAWPGGVGAAARPGAAGPAERPAGPGGRPERPAPAVTAPGCKPMPPEAHARSRATTASGATRQLRRPDPRIAANDEAIHQKAGAVGSAPVRAQGRVHLRPRPLRHAPVGAGHEPRRVQGPVPGQNRHLPAPSRRATGDRQRDDGVVAGWLTDGAQFLFQVQLWFFKQMAENIKEWKTPVDGFGNSLLDYTVVPYVTEVGARPDTSEAGCRR